MSNKQLNVGFAGLTHGHYYDLVKHWGKVANLRAVADPSDDLTSKASHLFEKSFSSLDQLLNEGGMDVFVVTSDNKSGAEFAIKALEKGIPVMMEKPMAATYAAAKELLDVHLRTKTPLMINWPFVWFNGIQALHSISQSGAIGDPLILKYRTGHRGPKEIGCGPEFYEWLYSEELNGGGAIADFGGYGAALSLWILGIPQKVVGMRDNLAKPDIKVDDHAFILLEYHRAHAMLEATWATVAFETAPCAVVHGTTGMIATDNHDIEIVDSEGRRTIEKPSFEGPGDPATYFIEVVLRGKPAQGMLNPELAANAVKIVDLAKKSSESGQRLSFSN